MGRHQLRLSAVMEQLPEDCRAWVRRLTPGEEDSMNTILNHVGVEDFVKRWRELRQDLEAIEHEFGMRL